MFAYSLDFLICLLSIDFFVIFCGFSFFFPYSFNLSNKKLCPAVKSFAFLEWVMDNFADLSGACMAEKSVLSTGNLILSI